MATIKTILDKIHSLFELETRKTLKNKYEEKCENTEIAQPIISVVQDVIDDMYGMEQYLDDGIMPSNTDIRHLYDNIITLFIIVHHKVIMTGETIDMADLYGKLNIHCKDDDLIVEESRYVFLKHAINLICSQCD